MNFKPKTEKEINEANLIPAGDYAFEVLDAIADQSNAGNDMITLTLRIFVGEGSRQLNDYLMEKVAYKLFHFCSYMGLSKQYTDGTLKPEDCLGKTGYLSIGIQKGKKKDDGSGEVWPDRNSVKDYIRTPAMKSGQVVASKVTGPDEDVPF